MIKPLADPAAGHLALAVVERIEEDGRLRVRLPGQAAEPARSVAGVTRELLERTRAAGHHAAVVARIGDEAVVLGVLASSVPAGEARVDAKKVVLTGEEEVTLRCGKAAITLTKAGKVLIRGEYVLTHAGGVNRIRGSSVQIN
ncbi:MAG: hypothetical protein HY716_16135 [Planctomycetes bacterium]|nr:hypothetical protein [Planctomycetota bacterium]